jgi:hypothetical protein
LCSQKHKNEQSNIRDRYFQEQHRLDRQKGNRRAQWSDRYKKRYVEFWRWAATGGEFTVDTTSIKILDITDPATNAQFAGHLASDDFFASEQYPEAKLVITSVSPMGKDVYDVNGDLTIKGITHPTVFSTEVTADNNTLTATGKIIIDRTRYAMRFRSGNFFKDLGDTLIYNDFELYITITAKA